MMWSHARCYIVLADVKRRHINKGQGISTKQLVQGFTFAAIMAAIVIPRMHAAPKHFNNQVPVEVPQTVQAKVQQVKRDVPSPQPQTQPESVQSETAKVETAVQQAPAPVAAERPHIPPSPVDVVRELAAQKGWTGNEWESLYQLVYNESSWNPGATNSSSGACGLFQALPCSKVDLSSIESQCQFGLSYIQVRYGTPSNALAQWNARYPHWY